ncbi:MAG TPA: CHAT domain-containing protein, partial [Cytophagaceae bacterium]|nr:CHAT domain-containing protein [Cytophagaceae bacterium]
GDIDYKIRMRRRISFMDSKADFYKRKNKDYTELCYLEATRICDVYQGYYDCRDGIGENKPLWHSGHYIYSLKQYYLKIKELKKIEYLPLFHMERHLKFQKIEFGEMTSEEKANYLNGIFRKNLDEFSSLVLKNHKEDPSLIKKLYEYQIAFKEVALESEIKMITRASNSKDTLVKALFEEWKFAKDSLARYKKEFDEEKLKAISDKVYSLEYRLYYFSETGEYLNENQYGENWDSEISSDEKQIESEQIQKILKPNEASIEIVRFKKYTNEIVTDTIVYAFLILTADSPVPKFIPIMNGNDMETRYFAYYKNQINFKNTDSLSYNIYWKDISEYLTTKKIKKIHVCSDGIYHSINLSTLFNPISKKFLIDDYTIHLISNSKDLIKTLPKKKQKAIDAALYGYPKYKLERVDISNEKISNERSFTAFKTEETRSFFENNPIPMLPGTKVEVEVIEKMLLNENVSTDKRIYNSATEENLKSLKHPDILHVATHGFYLKKSDKTTITDSLPLQIKENPLFRSGLLLAGCENHDSTQYEDGILTSYEAMGLYLDSTDLVVLSACETGIGDIQNTEGVYGLQRAFQIAGAKTIIMSLWKVDDTATKEFMIEFYKNYITGSNKLTSFKKAQLKLKEKFNQPYYWGAFVMIGE